MPEGKIFKTDIYEYCEEMIVEIKQLSPQYVTHYRDVMSERSVRGHEEFRWVVKALNEAGHNSTEVDLVELLDYVKKYLPELLDKKDSGTF